jgi:hypothetical protein
MSERILQINFKFSVPPDQFKKHALGAAEHISVVKGLRWKIWLNEEEKQEGGGLDLFEDEASLEAYVEGPVAEFSKSPIVSDISIKRFNIHDEATAITRGPVSTRVTT